MNLLWLKKIDSCANFVPKCLLRFGANFSAQEEKHYCVIRPGGLGDMVILTRAFIELGIDPGDLTWFAEKRNAIWLDYLGISYKLYHQPRVLFETLRGRTQFLHVVNTEQFHGLASLFAARLAGKNGTLTGFSENPRSDLFDQVVDYRGKQFHELDEFKRLISLAYRINQQSGGKNQSLDYLPPKSSPPALDLPYSILALGGLSHPYKKLSLDVWKKLLKRATGYTKKVVLLGAPNESDFALQLERESKQAGIDQLTNLVGRISFPDSVNYIRHSTRLLSVDSGLVHVADFFKIPSDVVFPWNYPSKWGALTSGSLILKPEEL